jgi:hypothetical protein
MASAEYRKVTKKARDEIRQAFLVYGGSGIPEEHLLLMLADHAVGLLELPPEVTADWYEKK